MTLAAAPAAKKSTTSQANTSQKSSSKSSNLIDINSASESELEALPGIGDAYSAAIVKNQPYANKRQLLSRKVVPQATYEAHWFD